MYRVGGCIEWEDVLSGRIYRVGGYIEWENV